MNPALKQMLAVCSVAVAAAVWLIASLVADRGALDRDAEQRMLTLSRLLAEHADSIMDSSGLMLEDALQQVTAAGLPRDESAHRVRIHEILESAVARTPAVDSLLLADTTGQVLSSSLNSRGGGSMRGEPYFEELLATTRDDAATATVRGRDSGRWGVILARPLHDAEGKLSGVLAAHIGLERTFLSLYRDLGLSAGTSIALWNRDRVLLLRQPFQEEHVGQRIEIPELDGFLAGNLRETSLIAVSPVDGKERMAAVRGLVHRPLLVSASQDRGEYLAGWRAAAWRMAFVAALLVAGCGLFGWTIARRSAAERRLSHMLDAAPIGVVCFDSNSAGRVVPFAANTEAHRCLPAGKSTRDGLPDLSPLGIGEQLSDAADSRENWHREDVRVSLGGQERRLDLKLFGVGQGQAGLLIEDATERHLQRERLEAEVHRWRCAVEDADYGIRDWNIPSGEMLLSKRWLAQLGYAPGELQPELRTWESLVHPADLPRCRREIETQVAGLSAAYRSEHRVRRRDGSYAWVLERGRVLERSEDGRAQRMLITQTDISPLRQIEDNLSLWGRVFASAEEGIIVTDIEARIVEVNDAYCQMTGYPRGRLVGENPRILGSGLQPAEFYQAMWATLQSAGVWLGELRNRRADGSMYCQRTKIIAVPDHDGRAAYYIGFTSDVSELRDSQHRVELLRLHDSSGKLPVRQQLTEEMRIAIAMAQRSNQLLAVCVVDVDHFKPINDRWGAQEGDRLLEAIAERLQAALRSNDRMARLGGDEFALLLGEIASPTECEVRLNEILASLRAPFERPGGSVRLTASVGATLYPLDGGDPDTLLRHADQALYTAKQSGSNSRHIFDSEQDRRLRIHRRAVSEVQAALHNDQLRLHYQPKVRLDDGKVVGVEALLRWQHAERGLLMPAEFISQINDEALLQAIGEWCLATAVDQADLWHKSGRSIPVSVNVTAGQILGPEFADRLEAMLDQRPDFPPQMLEVEILESAALADLPRVITTMERCVSRGVSFALDDFGTGYASLTYLKHLPAATLKIDQSFVRDILDDPEHRAIVEGVLGLTRVFGRTAIAEGVESIEHGVELIMLGATHGQGYAIAGALSADELPEWIENWRNPPEWTRATWRYRNQDPGLRAGSR